MQIEAPQLAPQDQDMEKALRQVRDRVDGADQKFKELLALGKAPTEDQADRYMNQAWTGFLNHKEGSQDFLKTLVNAGIAVPQERADKAMTKEMQIFNEGGYKEPGLVEGRLTLMRDVGVGASLPAFQRGMAQAIQNVREQAPGAIERLGFLTTQMGGRLEAEQGALAMNKALNDLVEGRVGARENLDRLVKMDVQAPQETLDRLLSVSAKRFAQTPHSDAFAMQTLSSLGGKLERSASESIALDAMKVHHAGLDRTKLEKLNELGIVPSPSTQSRALAWAKAKAADGDLDAADDVRLFTRLDYKVQPGQALEPPVPMPKIRSEEEKDALREMNAALRGVVDGVAGAQDKVKALQAQGVVPPKEMVDHYFKVAAADFFQSSDNNTSGLKALGNLGFKMTPELVEKATVHAAELFKTGGNKDKLPILHDMGIRLKEQSQTFLVNSVVMGATQGTTGSAKDVSTLVDMGYKMNREVARRAIDQAQETPSAKEAVDYLKTVKVDKMQGAMTDLSHLANRTLERLNDPEEDPHVRAKKSRQMRP